ncbi:MAG: glycosyltransferase [Acidobacteriia bacterium]|nr:glycosyltransferase [Terriglobia bacterium]
MPLHESIAYPRVTIVIPVNNESWMIRSKLEDTFALDYPAFFEVIVVDDGDDRTCEIAGEFAEKNGLQKRMKILHLERRLGKAHALNVALSMSEGEIFVSTDVNASVDKGSLTELVHALKSDDRIACVSGARTVPKPRSVAEKGEALYWGIDTSLRRKQSEYSNVRTSIGELSAYRTDAVKRVGGFPEKAVSEDFEMTVLLVAHGYQVKLCPQARVSEPAPATFLDLYERKARSTYGLLKGLSNNTSLIRKLEFRSAMVIVLSIILPCLAALSFIPGVLLCFMLRRELVLFSLSAAAAVSLVIAVWTNTLKSALIFCLYLITIYFAILGGIYRFLFKGQSFPWKRQESTRR